MTLKSASDTIMESSYSPKSKTLAANTNPARNSPFRSATKNTFVKRFHNPSSTKSGLARL